MHKDVHLNILTVSPIIQGFGMRIISSSVSLFLALLTLPGDNLAANTSEFQKWLDTETTSFKEYRDKRDKEFTGFLKDQWKEMQTFQGLVRDDKPKPVRIPKAPDIPTSEVPDSKEPTVEKPVTEPVIVKVKPLLSEPVKKPRTPTLADKRLPGRKVSFNFYGHMLNFYYDPKLIVRATRPINEKTISSIWSSMSLANYDSLLKQLVAQKKPLALNDWGFVLLTHTLAQRLHPGNRNDQSVFTWYLLTKAGFNSRIAYDRNYIYLLLSSRQQLYEAPYFIFDNIRYYALSFDGIKQKPGRIFTYNGHYPDATHKLDMRLDKSIKTQRQQKDRYLDFDFNKKHYRIAASYDTQTVKYLQTYPQMDIQMYFNSSVNSVTANPILNQLKPLVEGKSEEEAVNLLLKFVQTAFRYKTDQQQFGIENYLFPEETLHYPYSDCEDRSVFFAWLVHNLLGLNVIGLDYPGHIATAVNFSSRVSGDSVLYKGKKYTISDPTYINAKAGMTMPLYSKHAPGIINILN